MLPCGGTLARGQVTERKRDHEGNVIGRSNANPILDTQEYEMKFEDGNVTKLTANAIAESMYAMCDQSGNVSILKLHFIFSSVKDIIGLGYSNDIAFVVTFALCHLSPRKGATARQH